MGRFQWLLVPAFVAWVVLFYNLGDFRTFGSHEAYAVVPAREMMESGDWIVPRFGGLPRLQKPPLAYWTVAGSAWLCGELNEWSARLPAALAAAALAVLMGVWAGRWYGRTAGVWAVIIQSTAAYVVVYARKAEVDMLLCLLTTAALFLFAQQPLGESRRRAFVRWVGIYGLVALAWMAKFHYGAAMVLGPCVVHLVIQRRFRSLWQLANPVGLLLLGSSIFLWPYLVLQRLPDAWQVWRAETFGRAMGEMSNEPLWYYLPHLVGLALPWTPFALAAVPGSWRRAWKERDARERFLWIWLCVQMAIVTASADKHKHYLNAALPMLTLLSAQGMVLLANKSRRGRPIVETHWAIVHTALLAALMIGTSLVVMEKWPTLRLPIAAAIVLFGGGGMAVSWLLAFRREFAAGGVALAAFSAGYITAVTWIVPVLDRRLEETLFVRQVREEVAGARRVCVYQMGMSPVVYYLDRPVFRVESPQALVETLNREGKLLVVTFAPTAAGLATLGEQRIVRQMPEDVGKTASLDPPLVVVEMTRRERLAEAR